MKEREIAIALWYSTLLSFLYHTLLLLLINIPILKWILFFCAHSTSHPLLTPPISLSLFLLFRFSFSELSHSDRPRSWWRCARGLNCTFHTNTVNTISSHPHAVWDKALLMLRWIRYCNWSKSRFSLRTQVISIQRYSNVTHMMWNPESQPWRHDFITYNTVWLIIMFILCVSNNTKSSATKTWKHAELSTLLSHPINNKTSKTDNYPSNRNSATMASFLGSSTPWLKSNTNVHSSTSHMVFGRSFFRLVRLVLQCTS